ncbi:MAG: T9SS type A sorting domain-containing protein [Calditrichaeota bacterium]|nr:T9SS type A sorting domain-containing protein [Calditrichota bacterium]MCB0269768.1 T9SS type A sorting domain-containing protein [Calditrichota bacterium]MCB0285415.1 T9SS type A sorting domain-containing protein [Calditrichota bacterium]MCB9067132.1 T9SS type A sorting domain-containing protein [Calditrichia bacterium]
MSSWNPYEFDISAFAGQNIYVALVYLHQNGGPNGEHSDNLWLDHFSWTGTGIVAIDDDQPAVAKAFSLEQNYPNPFNPETRIRYSVPKSANVTLSVYNLVGQKVAVLVNETQASGTYEISFDASHLSSGVYFYQLQAGEFSNVRKMLLTR